MPHEFVYSYLMKVGHCKNYNQFINKLPINCKHKDQQVILILILVKLAKVNAAENPKYAEK